MILMTICLYYYNYVDTHDYMLGHYMLGLL
jgi:hypothetical protein